MCSITSKPETSPRIQQPALAGRLREVVLREAGECLGIPGRFSHLAQDQFRYPVGARLTLCRAHYDGGRQLQAARQQYPRLPHSSASGALGVGHSSFARTGITQNMLHDAFLAV